MCRRAIVISGASGLVGGLIASSLLANEPSRTIVLPIRQKNDPQKLREYLMQEAFGSDREAAAAAAERLEIVALPRTAEQAALVPELSRALSSFEVTDIVHAAGCLSYFNAARAAEGNQQLTSRLLQVARNLGSPRFAYISTAFASGYVDGMVAETLHEPDAQDPNEYTRSKRETELLVASSGLSYLIVRPSVVVGSSLDGRYAGKPYGAYQVWTGLCRFLCDRQRLVIHAVAPRVPFHAIHQDALQSAFLAGFRSLPSGAVFHVVSDAAHIPTLQDCWHLWMLACGRPREVRYYSTLEALPKPQLDEAERLFIEFSEANIAIASHRWQFETKHLDALRAAGLRFNDVTLASMDRCLSRFLEQNSKAQRFLERTRELGSRDWVPAIVQAS